MLQRMIVVLWPSFLIAVVADVVFFALFDPSHLLRQEDAFVGSNLAAYTVGFFLFWLMGIGSSSLTCHFQRSPDEINRCPLTPDRRPPGCPKREGCTE
ncbi:MAG TPA: hypothetical protein DHV08_00690 [Rhodocyclaceae bacterium]|nr:MAG: hypothetical protein AUK49_08705 [Betaproteobacteria bacterium CG2_30_68_42]PIX75449.1 MAG: hypothetical protein COZ38_05525 [Rhodocyclales bacterium CG_4_10_14_3_um_filter_68_10]PJA58466.1 MAG: hypothetical protein CO164_02320 [Rhodocyclales bacterium CG_4_9_14_3_um_filter_68_10]HCX32194.1 hypothetical protein [Rhodocyclaceae bacterium]